MTSARPATAMPVRNSTSRDTKNAEKTRPRYSRGVLRWRTSDREIEDGGWEKPEIVTSTIAIQMFEASPYRMPTMPITVKLITIQVPSGSRSMYFAISRLPKTKPSEVRPSWSPYWNSVPPRVSMANGSSSTFHRPNAKSTGAKTISVERRIGVRTSRPTPDLRLATTALTLVSSSIDASARSSRTRRTPPR